MNYAKIDENGALDLRYCDPDDVEKIFSLLDEGFSEFVGEEQPETQEGYIAKDSLEIYDGRIFQSWQIIADNGIVQAEIMQRKDNLFNSDYKIIKCLEAFIAGEPLPYDFEELREERQKERDEINRLEATV